MPFLPGVPAVPAALYTGDLATGAAAAGNSTRAYLVQIYNPTYCTLTGLRVRFSAGAGGANHYDIGIYDATGTNNAPNNLLAHSGSVVTAAGVQTYTLPTAIGLAPGNYWLAFWIDNATDTFTQETGISGMVPLQTGTIASGGLTTLASSIVGLANGTVMPHLLGLVQGGWS